MIKKILRSYNDKELKRIYNIIPKIYYFQKQYKDFVDEDFKNKTLEFKERLKGKETLDDLLPEAFALVKEASQRTLGMSHYVEQLLGGILLHQGRIAEIKTGEGKTLVATLPLYLNSLTEKGVHIITSNDYLAQRDCDFAKPLFDYLGITVAYLVSGPSATNEEKALAYNADITYGTHSEFGFDYLRDNLVSNLDEKVQREHIFALVDEIDSILIDDAKTPLIISSLKDSSDKNLDCIKANEFVKSLILDEDISIDKSEHSALLTNSGISKAEVFYSLDNYSDLDNHPIHHLIAQSLRAHFLLEKDIDYIVADNKIQIVDASTGRILDGREFSDGLHQALEAKEDIDISSTSGILATITYQSFFNMYKKLSGMSGTALTSEEEFKHIYNLDVIVVPTHKKINRIDRKDIIYSTHKNKLFGILQEVEISHKKKQPVLIGTQSIKDTLELSNLLSTYGFAHNVLNAKNNKKEAEIISRAGELGSITISTNMAGRGTDIKISPDSIIAGGLKVIGTTRHESKRVDDQLRGRSGRQGDVGESVFIISLEDDIVKLSDNPNLDILKKRSHLFSSLPINDDDNKLYELINKIQTKIESDSYDVRKNLSLFEQVTDYQREYIYKQRDGILSYSNDELDNLVFNVIEELLSKKFINLFQTTSNLQKIYESIKEYLTSLNISIDDDLWVTLNELEEEEFLEKTSTLLKDNYYNLKEGFESDNFNRLIKNSFLKSLDNHWVEHLNNMQLLKQNAVLSYLKQEEPICGYKINGSNLFNDMLYFSKEDIVKRIFSLSVADFNIL